MHRKEGLMFKNMGQTYADMKKLHEEAAGMPLEDMFMEHIVKPFATRDALSHSLHRLNEDYESLKAENAELRRINHSLAADNQRQLSDAQAEIERYKALYEGLKNEIPDITAEAVNTALKTIEADMFDKIVIPTVNATTKELQAECKRLKDEVCTLKGIKETQQREYERGFLDGHKCCENLRMDAEAKLSRYEKAVEVEGYISFADARKTIVLNKDIDIKYRKRVKVLVMPMEGE